MQRLGEVRNRTHDGLFVIFCDAKAKFGGWDVYGEQLADEGSMALDLDGQRAFVKEAHGSGGHVVLVGADGTIFVQPPLEPGVTRERLDVPGVASILEVLREFVGTSQVVALRPVK